MGMLKWGKVNEGWCKIHTHTHSHQHTPTHAYWALGLCSPLSHNVDRPLSLKELTVLNSITVRKQPLLPFTAPAQLCSAVTTGRQVLPQHSTRGYVLHVILAMTLCYSYCIIVCISWQLLECHVWKVWDWNWKLQTWLVITVWKKFKDNSRTCSISGVLIVAVM